MISVFEVTKLMDYGVLKYGLRCEYQLPVQVNDVVLPTATPEMLLFLDADGFRIGSSE